MTNTKTSKMAVTSMVLGILSIFIGWLTLAILPIIAVVLGHKAQGKIKRSAGALVGEGKAVAGYITGYISLALFIPMTGIIAAIAIPVYHEYTIKTHIIGARTAVAAHKVAIAEQLEKGVAQGEINTDPAALGLRDPVQYLTRTIDSIRYDSYGQITLTFRDYKLPFDLQGRKVVYVPVMKDGRVHWRVDKELSTVTQRHLFRFEEISDP